jgi:hypothetical protein
MAPATSSIPAAGGRHQRRFKNYLLDAHFQLKYSSYLVVIAVVLSVGLGVLIWRTSNKVIDQSWSAVRQGEEVVARGKEVVAESQKVSAVVQMNIIKDPVYSDSPALLEAFKSDAAKQDERLKEQQDQLVKQAAGLKGQAAALAHNQNVMLWTLCGALARHSSRGWTHLQDEVEPESGRARPSERTDPAPQGRRARGVLRGLPVDGDRTPRAAGRRDREARSGDRGAFAQGGAR